MVSLKIKITYNKTQTYYLYTFDMSDLEWSLNVTWFPNKKFFLFNLFTMLCLIHVNITYVKKQKKHITQIVDNDDDDQFCFLHPILLAQVLCIKSKWHEANQNHNVQLLTSHGFFVTIHWNRDELNKFKFQSAWWLMRVQMRTWSIHRLEERKGKTKY